MLIIPAPVCEILNLTTDKQAFKEISKANQPKIKGKSQKIKEIILKTLLQMQIKSVFEEILSLFP